MGSPKLKSKDKPGGYLSVPSEQAALVQTAIICGTVLVITLLLITAFVSCYKGQSALDELGKSIQYAIMQAHQGVVYAVGYATLYGWLVSNFISSIWNKIQQISMDRSSP